MKLPFFALVIFFPVLINAQKFQRRDFDYEKLKKDSFVNCNEKVTADLDKSIMAIQANNSAKAVKNAKEIYEINKECPEIYGTYALSLFRSGEWFDAVDILENAIEIFGSVPELIKLRSEFSIEMGELGTGEKHIDGNSVYKYNAIKYDEEQFKEENYRSALVDLEYLVKKYNNSEDIFYAAKVYQLMKNYNRSNELFQTLINDETYSGTASYNIAENYIGLNQPIEAEKRLLSLLYDNPKNKNILDKLSNVYDLKNDSVSAKEYKNKSVYYTFVPEFSDMEYSVNNHALLTLFGSNAPPVDKKLKRLKEIYTDGPQEYVIDVCLMILKLHTNHGNGVEDEATNLLIKIGKPAIEKVHKLFKSDVSTCTITNLASIMAKVKDSSSWPILVDYLPYITSMPMTLTPPSVPEKIIEFDKEKGVVEVLKVIKGLLVEEGSNDNNPMAELSGFGNYVFYYPLQKIKMSKLISIAKSLNYSDKEIKKLKEELKD
jgi:tetratricopeptide (TPR) repeat protein